MVKTNVYYRHGKTGISKRNKELDISLKREIKKELSK